jgi:hypothetical protein
MRNETCANETLVLAARRAGRWTPDLLRHLRECAACSEVAEVAESIGNLGSLVAAPPLPDPDWLWMRAQIQAQHDAAVEAMWIATRRRAVWFGAVIVGTAWLSLEWLAAGRSSLDAWASTIVSLAADPLLGAAVAALAAAGTALVTAGVFFARSFVARQLRYAGLL